MRAAAVYRVVGLRRSMMWDAQYCSDYEIRTVDEREAWTLLNEARRCDAAVSAVFSRGEAVSSLELLKVELRSALA
jgi:hypothetical protein